MQASAKPPGVRVPGGSQKTGLRTGVLGPGFPHAFVGFEPFGGGASILLNLDPYPCEVYNDLDAGVVDLFPCP